MASSSCHRRIKLTHIPSEWSAVRPDAFISCFAVGIIFAPLSLHTHRTSDSHAVGLDRFRYDLEDSRLISGPVLSASVGNWFLLGDKLMFFPNGRKRLLPLDWSPWWVQNSPELRRSQPPKRLPAREPRFRELSPRRKGTDYPLKNSVEQSQV